jgi:hypothetical protein
VVKGLVEVERARRQLGSSAGDKVVASRNKSMQQKAKELFFVGGELLQVSQPRCDLTFDFGAGETCFSRDEVLWNRGDLAKSMHGSKKVTSLVDIGLADFHNGFTLNPIQKHEISRSIDTNNPGHTLELRSLHELQGSDLGCQAVTRILLTDRILLERILLACGANAIDTAIAAGPEEPLDSQNRRTNEGCCHLERQIGCKVSIHHARRTFLPLLPNWIGRA